jgi:hypothetical protein
VIDQIHFKIAARIWPGIKFGEFIHQIWRPCLGAFRTDKSLPPRPPPLATPWYDHITRCVRRTFLCGEGGGNRKDWIENRIRISTTPSMCRMISGKVA